jgi:UPF0755 protein
MNKALVRTNESVKSTQIKRSKGILSISKFIIMMSAKLLGIIIVIIFATYLCRYTYNFCYQVFGSVAVSDEGKGFVTSVTIDSGITLMQVADSLENKGLIVDKNSFYIKAKLDGAKIQPGTFILSSEMDYDEILEIITASP